MSMQTRSQRVSRAAFPRVEARKNGLNEKKFREYTTFAKKFPSLVHACGLAQAVAFAMAKQESDYLNDLCSTLTESGCAELKTAEALRRAASESALQQYVILSRHTLRAAEWLKRYVEALGGDEE
ncbi:MAG: hypothetical protein KatS3mg105_5227 [Gemmatales bacterium]|nr:MAG: hypothetical protein KatS3mg105_5227 [Gemmatales bacterium]